MKARSPLALALALALAAAAPARADEAPAAAAPVASALTLTLLHTNDLHGQVLPPPRGPGGFVALGRTIRQERDRARARGDAVLLLDAGDIYKGTPEGDLTDGQAVVAWMNHLGYDAGTVGNHEFDHGLAVVARLGAAARFPLLGANICEGPGGPRPAWLGRGDASVPPALRGCAIVRELPRPGGGRARVAVVGVTTSAMREVTLKGVTGGLDFPDEVEVLTQVLDALGPADLVVLLTHCGVGVDAALAERLGGQVDIIIGGHSHTRLPEGKRVGPVLVAQTGARGAALGVIRVTLPAPGAPRAAGAPRCDAQASLVPAGDDLEGVLQPFVDEVRAKVDVPVGNLAADLGRRPGWESSSLGNLHVDLMRQATGADLAFHNKTGIRADLAAGVVRWRDVYQVAPFGNTVSTLRLSGADVRALLEGMLGAPHLALEVSGCVVRADPARPEGQRVVELQVGDAPLDPARTYLVATNNFLAPGGDGHVAFTRGADLRDTGVVLLDLLLEHFRTHDPWDPGPLDERVQVRRGE